MPNSKDLVPANENFKFLLLGDYGTGKSTFAATCPTPGYLFNFDDRAITYKGKDFDYDTFPISAQGWMDFEGKLRDVIKAVADGKYKTVVVDSTTAMTDVAMERSMALDPKRNAVGGPMWNVHYGMVKNLIEGRMRQLINLNCNLVVCCHLRPEKDDDSGAIMDYVPMLTGQLSVTLPGFFDEVYICTTKRSRVSAQSTDMETEYLLQTVPIGMKKARSAMSGKEHILPDFIPNNYDEITKRINKD
jgi:hypothetical protein